jgi:hypothetical protein
MQEAYQYTVPKTVENLKNRLEELGFRDPLPVHISLRIQGFAKGELLIVRDFLSVMRKKACLVSTNYQFPLPYVFPGNHLKD